MPDRLNPALRTTPKAKKKIGPNWTGSAAAEPTLAQVEQELDRSFGFESLMAHAAIQRLRQISFLGILGPGVTVDLEDTRYRHSLRVAFLTAVVLERARLPKDVRRHAVAAALLHDVANRALSHTLEAAFDSLGNTTGRRLTYELVFTPIPRHADARLSLRRTLDRLGLSVERVLGLLRKRPPLESLEKADRVAADWFRSRLTPDTLDGIARAGKLFGLPETTPMDLAVRLRFDAARGLGLASADLAAFDDFWKLKGLVYSDHINSAASVSVERACAFHAVHKWTSYTAAELFGWTDKDVRPELSRVVTATSWHGRATHDARDLSQQDLFPDTHPLRFRPPQSYWVRSEAEVDSVWISLAQLRRRYRAGDPGSAKRGSAR